ncbi:MAG: hypothetical protein GY764_06690 [Halieaceae bacterium]|nr:hypothetical protein [Halieaceae bacterium]
MANVLEHSEKMSASTEDLFRARMLEQVRQIRRYRKKKLKDTGRLMSLDEAAIEWIERYASSFDMDAAFKGS